jgi:hypothetical protein
VGRTGHAAPKSMDERGARCAVLEHQNGVVVSCTGELGAALGEAPDVLAQALPRLLLAVAQLPLLARACVGALEVPDEDSTQVGPVVDLVPRQILEPCPCGVAEVERQILDDEEVVRRSPGMASEPVVLEPHAGVGVSVVPRYVGRSVEARGEPRTPDALAKGPWTSLAWRPAMVAVVVAVVAPPKSVIVVVA